MLREQYLPLHTQIYSCPSSKRDMDPLIKNKSSSDLHFIGDIFMLWSKSENQLKSFINEINKKHHNIKFDVKFSTEKIEFLDTLGYKNHSNRLQTTLHIKPADRQNYLHSKSLHSFSVFFAVKH